MPGPIRAGRVRYNNGMEILLAIVVFAVCMLAFSVGLLFKGRCLRGSCGGEPMRVGNVTLGCGSCPKRADNTCPAPTEESSEQVRP